MSLDGIGVILVQNLGSSGLVGSSACEVQNVASSSLEENLVASGVAAGTGNQNDCEQHN